MKKVKGQKGNEIHDILIYINYHKSRLTSESFI